MPRAKKADKISVIANAPGVITSASAVEVTPMSPAELIAEHRKLEAFADAQTKAFTEHMKPHVERMAEIKQQLLEFLLAQKARNISTDEGTAYISTIVSHKIDPAAAAYLNDRGEAVQGREAVLDWSLENWDKYGNEGLQINLAKAVVEQVIQDTGAPPPGLVISQFQKVNIRKS